MPDEMNKRRFLTIEQVAEELATSEVQIRSMLKSGQLKGTSASYRKPLAANLTASSMVCHMIVPSTGRLSGFVK